MTRLLRIRDLEVEHPGVDGEGPVPAVDGVSLDLEDGEILAIAGESGAGKTTLGRAILGFVPPGSRVSGTLELNGVDMVHAPERRRRPLRGRTVAWIPQAPRSALHPTLGIGRQLEETIRACRSPTISRRDARREARRWLDRVGLGGWEGARSHELSGGMRQRALLALALAGEPRLVVADEPTTALDPELAVEVGGLLLELVADLGLALLWIGHDLDQIAALGGELAILYRGRLIERGPCREVLDAPAHPYTVGLVACGEAPEPGEPWPILPPPRGDGEGTGCAYWSRCPRREDPRCETERPPLRSVPGRSDQLAATWCRPAERPAS